MTNNTSTKSTKVGRVTTATRSLPAVAGRGDKAAAKRDGRDQRTGERGDSKTTSPIRFSATLHRPAATGKTASRHGESSTWSFLTLPKEASAKLPSRGQTTVEGTINGSPLRATLEPDGQGGRWLKVDRKLREAAGGITLHWTRSRRRLDSSNSLRYD